MRTSTVLLSAVLFSLAGRAALGQEEEEKKSFVVRPAVFERLQAAQEAMEKENYEELDKQVRIIRKRFNPNDHELALTLQLRGYAYASQEKLGLAARTLQEALDLNALPEATQESMMYSLGQLLLAGKKYDDAVQVFDRWLAVADDPTPRALYTVAAAKYQSKDMRGAAKYASRAVAASREPKDSWLQLQMSAHIELKQWRPAIEVMKRLVERHPEKRNNWLQLAALYGEIDDEARALAVMQLAYEAGVFEKKSDYTQLAQRLQSKENHYRAAEILERAVKQGKVERDAEVAKTIGLAWFVAREHDEAKDALARAASMADDGKLYIRLAQLNIERESWADAAAAGRRALAKGGIDSPGKVHLLIGIAEARRGRSAAARRAFATAAKSPETKRAAEGWMNFLSSSAAPVPAGGSGTSPE